MFPEKKHSFPKRASREYHDLPKPREKLASFHKQKPFVLENPENIYMVTPHQRVSRKIDQNVIKQRQELIQHTTKVSEDTPDWWKSSYKYYYRSNMPSYKSDPFNSYRTIKQARKTISREENSLRNKSMDITPKVGSVDRRDYTIKKPALKVGQDSFIDTYSVF